MTVTEKIGKAQTGQPRLVSSPGTIIVPTSEVGRFAMFTVSLAGTNKPSDTNLTVMASASVTENLNAGIRQLRDEDRWVWILGDDHVWESDCLLKLLSAMDATPEAGAMVPLVTKRNPPWHLVLFHHAGGEPGDGMPRWKPYDWEEIPESGVFKVAAAGSAGMVIRREVLDAIGDPWFESTGGVILNEDLWFCVKISLFASEYRVYACADATMGHLGIFNVRPARRDGRWGAMTEFSSPEEQYRHMFMPDAEEHALAVNGR